MMLTDEEQRRDEAKQWVNTVDTDISYHGERLYAKCNMIDAFMAGALWAEQLIEEFPGFDYSLVRKGLENAISHSMHVGEIKPDEVVDNILRAMKGEQL